MSINFNSQSDSPAISSDACASSEVFRSAAFDAGATGAVAIFYADLTGSIMACNQTALEIFGDNSAEVQGRSLASLIAGDDAQHGQLQKAILASVLQDGHYHCSCRCRTKSKKDFAAELSVTLLCNGGSAPVGVVALLRVVQEKPSLGRDSHNTLGATENGEEGAEAGA